MNAKLCAALALAAGLFAAAAIAYGSGDGDLFWQRALGEAILRTHTLPTTLGSATFSAPDARWLPHEWLFATLWALANRRDAEPIFRLGCVGLACATMVVSLARARTAATPARMVMIVVGAIALLPSFGLRAQVVAWPLLALAMWALESGRRRAWLVLPLAVIWYNLHASALVVPCIVLVDGLGRTLDARRARPFLEAAALAGACTLASLATPFGPELPRFTLAWSTNPATRIIAEWEPASPGRALAMVGMVVIALLLVVGELRGARLRWSQRLLAAVLFAAALLHLRNLALFCIVAGPWTCAALSQLLPRDVGSRQRQRWSDAGLVALAVGCALVLAAIRTRMPVLGSDVSAAAAQVAMLPGQRRVACEDFSWCSRFAGTERVRVLMDGRTDAYPPAVIADDQRLLGGDPLAVLTRWRVDTAIVHAQSGLARRLAAAGWICRRTTEPMVCARPSRAVEIGQTAR